MHVYWHSTNKSVEKITDIVDQVSQIGWSGADTEASRSMTLTLIYNPDKAEQSAPLLKSGDIVSLYNDNNERLFFGRIITKDRPGEKGSVSYTVKDYMNNILKSNTSKKYKGKSAASITKDACKRVGISCGHLASTGYSIPKLYATDTPVYNIAMRAYKLASAQTGVQYFPYMDGKRFCVKEKGQLVGRSYNESTKQVEENFILSGDANITSATVTEDASDMVNKVDIYKKGKKIGSVSKSDWIKTFGTLQATLSVEKGNGRSAAKKALTNLEKTMSLDAIGDERCIAGAGVHIKDDSSGLVGIFWVKSDSHTWQNGNHQMSLELTLKNVTENPEVGSDSSTSSSSSSVSTGVLNGKKRTGIRFTAYAIGEGGTKDERGRALKYGERTIAADFLKYGQKVQIFGTGTKYDKKVMTVRDCGLGNNHTIDILMTKSEERSWNNPSGYIIISDGTGYKTTGGSSLSSSQSKVVKEAKKWLGKVKYVWGATNVTGGRSDCSGFTRYVFKHAVGKDIGRTTYDQVTHGTKVSKWSSLRAGDLILFNTVGRCTHVGICISKQHFIHCGCSHGVHMESMGSSYYRSKFYMGRRIV
jgi:cell wall-associated NlpC family hydrolase